MRQQHRKNALILSNRLFASHQIASILDQHGWQTHIVQHMPDDNMFRRLRPGIVVADIDDHRCRGIHSLKRLCQFSAIAYAIALCAGGNTPEMRMARSVGVDGFFYLNAAGLALDAERGLAPLFLHTYPELNPDRPQSTSHSRLQPCCA